MKKIFLVLMTVILCISFTACIPFFPITTDESDYSSSREYESSESAKSGTLPQRVQETTQAPTKAEDSAIKPGNYIQKSTFKFSFLKAATYNEIKSSEYFSNKPAAGKEYLVLFFEVENVSNENQYVNTLYFKAYVDNYDVSEKYLMGDVDGYSSMLSSGRDLAPGKKTKGYMAYEVDKSWKNFETIYKEGFLDSDEKYVFAVSSSDLS